MVGYHLSLSGWRILAAAVAVCAGCSGSAESTAREESSLKPLALLVGQYTGQHQGRAPANEAEFKKFVETKGEFLRGFNTDSEKVFVSQRDNKPYVVVYGKPRGPAEVAGAPVIAYEQEGVGGKRYVASSLGAVEEVDNARFRKLVPDAK